MPWLELQRRWHPDPSRRREAALLQSGLASGDATATSELLRGQGWGPQPLAAVVLKLEALQAEQQGRGERADRLWRALQRRFPTAPATADALYALGRREPSWRHALLQRFPAHPAALAAALELGPEAPARRRGAVHLARWGPRWPGAEERLRQACRQASGWSAGERESLATGLARLGDGAAASRCLAGQRGAAASELALGQALLAQAGSHQAGAERLLALVQHHPRSREAEEAVRLLSQGADAASLARLAQLPPQWQNTAPVQARRALASGQGWQTVLQRWPQDAASRELQWQLARQQLLKGNWSAARTLLEALPAERLPPPLAARQWFWQGWLLRRQGQPQPAQDPWRQLLRRFPGGYYGWRAAIGLGQVQPHLSSQDGPVLTTRPWRPLASGLPLVDDLWRLQQPLEAWESWRHQRRQPASTAAELQVEGRLRLAIGDDWTGLEQLEQANLRLEQASCPSWLGLEQDLHPARFDALLAERGRTEGVSTALLLGLAKQESRFSPGVISGAEAVGLLQLMPATAAELAGRPMAEHELKDPKANASLGARYLAQLLRQWNGEDVLAVASYNAGAGAVTGWITPQLQAAPELWVEAIPYPETRLYVKKVLGNAWSYQQLPSWRC